MSTNHLPRILAVDDEQSVLNSIKAIFDGLYRISTAQNGKQAIDLIDKNDIQLVILDLGLPDIKGMELLKKIRELNPTIEVIVLTADNTLRSGIEAMKRGAFDYLVKPFDVDQITIVVRNAIEKAGLLHEVRYRRVVDQEQNRVLIGQSKAMQAIFNIINQLADNDATVLITGESGTGKELVARALHNRGIRKDGPFVPVNCGAMPAELMESELFGHEKGAFTNASYKRTGKFEIAHRGTIFLDEISVLPLHLQAKLLRVIQERVIERIGGMRQIPVDVRIISATNVDLDEMIKEGKFREDLYFRLKVVPIKLSPLRQRKEDIPLLVKHFLNLYNKQLHRKIKDISPEVLEYFYEYQWKGNVRELENVIQRLLVISSNASITIKELPLELVTSKVTSAVVSANKLSLDEALTSFEKEYITRALVKSNNNRQGAAEILGVHRNTLLNRMKSLGMAMPEAEAPVVTT